MMKKVRVEQKGDSDYLPGQLVDRQELAAENARLKKAKHEQAEIVEVILGITKASLATESFLSAASFQETTKVLTDAALEGKTDRLLGLKENVIIGKLIPAATGLARYRKLEIEPTEPIPRPTPRRSACWTSGELAAELGLTGNGASGTSASATAGRDRRSARSWPTWPRRWTTARRGQTTASSAWMARRVLWCPVRRLAVLVVLLLFPSSASAAGIGTNTVDADSVYVRPEPQSWAIGTLYRGDRMDVQEVTDGGYAYGYIYGSFNGCGVDCDRLPEEGRLDGRSPLLE